MKNQKLQFIALTAVFPTADTNQPFFCPIKPGNFNAV